MYVSLKACVTGDTVGDPFKDTSGPSINVQMKLTSYISVVLAPVFKNQGDYWWVALIIIAAVLAFIPFWQWMTPAALKEENVEKILEEIQSGSTSDAIISPDGALPQSESEHKTVELTPIRVLG